MKKNILVTLLSFFALANVSQAQLIAEFIANRTSGCKPLTVQFTDKSTGSPTSWLWDLGNGNTSILQNPSATYTNPGTYTVKLTVTNAGGSNNTVTKTAFITVFKDPIASFTGTPTKGCAPLLVAFTDKSTQGDAAITGYSWNFGDGSGGSGATPSHTFGIGSFTIFLQVTDANGCKDDTTIFNYIKTSNLPTVSFSAPQRTGCDTPHVVNFTNNSSSGGFTYAWSFGDGDSSFVKNPSHSYKSFANFAVSLTVTDTATGCSNTLSQPAYIQVTPLTASFVTQNDTMCVGDNIFFNNTSSANATTFSWKFGDGQTSLSKFPFITYAASGKYIVELTASVGGACARTFKDSIYIDKVTASFTSSPNFGCMLPHSVTYTNTSTTALGANADLTYAWTFSNTAIPQSSTAKDPVISYTQEGIFSETLIVTSAAGCKATLIRNDLIKIKLMIADFIGDTILGCAPLTVNFTDKSTGVNGLPFTWSWNFADPSSGADSISTLQNPSHTFNTHGKYMVKLTITNSLGCTATDSLEIKVGIKPTPRFTFSDTTRCAYTEMAFKDSSFFSTGDPSSLIDEWFWKFGDQEAFGPDSKEPKHRHNDTGLFDVWLKVGYNGCYDSLLTTDTHYISGPVIKTLTPAFVCATPFDYTFVSDIISTHKWLWDFGDGTPTLFQTDTLNALDTSHTYALVNDYELILTAYNDTAQGGMGLGCYWEEKRTLNVRNIGADFLRDTSACSGVPVKFSGEPTGVIASDAGKTRYKWDFADGTPLANDTVATDTTHAYNLKGYYNPKLTITAVNGCTASVTKRVNIYRPDADFTSNNFGGCVPTTINFTDITNQTSPDTVLNGWYWNFGDSTSSILQNPSHDYLKPGMITVSLTVTDIIGCTNTETKVNYIDIKQPANGFTISDNTLCAGTAAQFTATNTTNVDWEWNFGDGTGTSTIFNPTYAYAVAGTYVVSLKVTDKTTGCDSTVTDTVRVEDIPVADFNSDKTITDCYPDAVTFFDISTGAVVSKFWTFGDGQSSILPSPVNTYNLPGNYDVSLTVTTSYGCSNTVTKTGFITVKGPIATYSINKNLICKGDTVMFVITSQSNVAFFVLDFGDGATDTIQNTQDTIYHVYQSSGTATVILTYYSDNLGTCDKSAAPQLITIKNVAASFTMSTDKGCQPLTVSFVENSTGTPNSWLWDFGDGSTSAVQAAAPHTYNNAGNYVVKLTITDNSANCTNSFQDIIVVYPLPVAAANPNGTICRGDSMRLQASGGVKYLWTPNTDLSNDTIANPMANPSLNTTYTVLVTDTNGCQSTASTSVEVLQPFDLSTSGDTSIVIGEFIDLFANSSNPNLIYTWTPSTGLSCTDCSNPSVQPLENITYTITVTDKVGCFTEVRTVKITVEKKFNVDVPTAFTPNGDGKNDIIFVRGWGIKEVLEYKVYNRWGQLVYENPGDIKQGWDGTYLDKPQNTETYIYLVQVKFFDDSVSEIRKGNFTLLR